MEDKLRILQNSLGSERIKFNESLYYHTFSKSEGRAQAFYIATTRRELVKALDLADELKIPIFVIGSGTKLFVSSTGLLGLVIKNRSSDVRTLGVKGKVGKKGVGVEEATIEVDSGMSLRKLNEYLKVQKLQEVDGFSSLHSTIGGAIFLDPILKRRVLQVEVWYQGNVLRIDLSKLNRQHIVLCATFKFKASHKND